MKKFLFFLIILPLLSFTVHLDDGGCCSKKKSAGGKCTGSANCTACKNCSGCKYCNSGGTCGVCAGGKVKQSTPYGSGTKPKGTATAGQCQALTKKGTQCSRKARSGGYCWQHGG